MKRVFYFLSVLIFSTVIFSCATTKEIPEGLTSAQMIQLGQNEYVSGNYKQAEKCYLEVIKKYGMDTAIYVEVKYELGHLYVNRKDYKKAFDAFTEILEIYENASYGILPPSYKKLAQIGMNKIPENKLKDLKKEAPAEE